MATPIKAKDGTYGIRISYTDPNGQHKRLYKQGFKTKREAKDWEYEFKKTLVTVTDTNKTLYDVLKEVLYVKEHIQKREDKTLSFYEDFFEEIIKYIPNKPIYKVTSHDLQKVIDENSEFPRKCYGFKQCFSSIFRYALKKEYIPNVNLLNKLDYPPYDPKPKNIIFENKAKKLGEIIKEFHPQIYAPYLLCLYLGLRPSEALAIKKEDVKEKEIEIKEATTFVKRKKDEVGMLRTHKTKTKNSKRNIPISKDFYKELFYYINLKNLKTDYICCNHIGEQLKPRRYAFLLDKSVDKYNAKYDDKIENITPYSLRHSFGNIMKRNNVDVYTTSRLMGHSSISTTTKNYYKQDEILNKLAMEKILINI